jgi:hypothetical protein
MSAAVARVMALPPPPSLADRYIAAGDTVSARKCHRHVAEPFTRLCTDFDTWLATPAADRLAAPLPVRGFAARAAVGARRS